MTHFPQGRPGINGYKGEKGEPGTGSGFGYQVSGIVFCTAFNNFCYANKGYPTPTFIERRAFWMNSDAPCKYYISSFCGLEEVMACLLDIYMIMILPFIFF